MSFLMKIVLAGDGAVGKTALRERYLGKGFSSNYMMTIGADFALKEATIREKNIKFQIWDHAGQPRFGTVRSVYYYGCLGALLLFDVTRPDTFTNLENWLEEIFKHNGKFVWKFLSIIKIPLITNSYQALDFTIRLLCLEITLA